MKKYILLAFLLVFSTQIYGQTLHASLFVNEREQGREVDRTADMNNMKSFFRDIANHIGYSYNLKANSDSYFTAREVDREIENLSVGNNDIIVFYYSGHGYNL